MSYAIICFALFVGLLNLVETKRQCIKGMTTPGYTTPPDDIVIKHGEPLDITCTLNEEYQKLNPNVTGEDLYFEKAGSILPKELTTVLNSSSIRLHIERPEMSSWVYNCKLKNAGVCLNTVYVGTPPTLLDDLNCTGINFENLTCSWTVPYNPVPTSYNIRYLTGSRYNRHLTHDCPNLQKLGAHKMSCTWTLTSQPPYRPAQDEITFELSSYNQLGTATLNKTIQHYKRVIPSLPENLTAINTTSNTITIRWSIPEPMQEFPPGLECKIMHRCEFDGDQWQLADTLYIRSKTKKLTYRLDNLTHSFVVYEIRVAFKSGSADPEDELAWSKYSYLTAKTKSKVPGRPPATTNGSFEVINNDNSRLRDIYVYWQHVSDKLKNGKGFKYEVELDSNSTLKPIEITNAYAKFSNMSMDESYTFKIWSTNVVGRSENFSSVVVPKQINGLTGPAHFTKLIRYDHTYELSWDAVPYQLNNLTIFACMYDRDRPYQCAGTLHWKTIQPHKLSYVVNTPEPKKIYQFAISASSDEFTSGMVWADCTVISSQIGNKLKNVWIQQVGTTFVLLNWKLDCSERIGGIGGFSVRYCDYDRYAKDDCEWAELTVAGVNAEKANITNLLPYKKYTFLVSKLTSNGEILQKSNYLFGTTQEAAPTPPTNVGISNTTNSSVTVFWKEPISSNGRISHYVILGKNHIFKVNATLRELTIDNLESYTNYNFSIFACTVSCSGPSSVPVAKTQGGYPSRIAQPGVTFQNDSFTLVEWGLPEQPNGNCDIYEIQFNERLLYENKTLSIVNTTEPWYIINDCKSNGRLFISVRAVNMLNGTRFEGPWSDELQSFCRFGSTFTWIWVSAALLPLLVVFVYLGRRMYFNCQKMRDIEVKLPPGLEVAVPNRKPSVIDEVPLKEKETVRSFGESKQLRYLPMGGATGDVKLTSEEYITMYAPNLGQDTLARYVQVGDLTQRNSIALVANNVPVTGYVTVSDILPGKRS